jgi:hypothetical protein
LPPIDWRLALKALAGFAVGIAIWFLLSPLYDRAIGAGAEKVMRVFESPKVTRLQPMDDGSVRVDRADFDPRSPRPGIRVSDLTFNLALLTALFAVSRRVFSDRNIGGFFAASAVLALTHVLATIARVMSIYVAKLGAWSGVHYSDLDRNVWGVADHFYRLVLMYAIAFALWWFFRDPGVGATARPKKKRR